jgi:hypothetical protein
MCRIATEFLFRRVVGHQEISKNFNEILARVDLCQFIKVISFGQAGPSDTISYLISLILSHEALWPLINRPTLGVIRQRRQGEFIATLTGIGIQNTPSVLPALEEICLISNEEPYLPIALFAKLRKLDIDMEYIRLPDDLVWPSLVDVHLRGTIDIGSLEGFWKNHNHIRQLHLAILATLRPLDASPGIVHVLSRAVLNSGLDTELVDSILQNAELNAEGHERSLLRHIHAQLDQMLDGSANKMHRALVAGFETYLEYELRRYSVDIGNMRIPLQTTTQFEVSSSIARFWEDELAIKGVKLPENYASKSGLWIIDEVKESLGKYYVYKRTG